MEDARHSSVLYIKSSLVTSVCGFLVGLLKSYIIYSTCQSCKVETGIVFLF
jgi:hypothetical protein